MLLQSRTTCFIKQVCVLLHNSSAFYGGFNPFHLNLFHQIKSESIFSFSKGKFFMKEEYKLKFKYFIIFSQQIESQLTSMKICSRFVPSSIQSRRVPSHPVPSKRLELHQTASVCPLQMDKRKNSQMKILHSQYFWVFKLPRFNLLVFGKYFLVEKCGIFNIQQLG